MAVSENSGKAKLEEAPAPKPKKRPVAKSANTPKSPAKNRPDTSDPIPAGPAPAGPAHVRPRHRRILQSFLLFVCVPLIGVATYLYTVAEDQYASYMGFSIRTEEASSAVDLLGGITQLGSSSGSDADILFEFMQSQRLVRAVDDELDLRAIYHMPSDPIFGLDPDSSIEDLMTYWPRMVKVFYNSSSGLIDIRVNAFDPQNAQRVAQAVYDQSSRMINDLSAIARDDATRYARQELELAENRLSAAREAVQVFRVRTQIVDPEADLLGRMGVLNSLQEQLAAAQIELDLLQQSSGPSDPRVDQAKQRVRVIEERLTEERRKISTPQDEGIDAYAELVGQYERLSVDLKFAQETYVVARGTLDSALAEAVRKSKYLAAYVTPTLAETPEYPQRVTLLVTIAGFLMFAWAMGVMIYYSLRERR